MYVVSSPQFLWLLNHHRETQGRAVASMSAKLNDARTGPPAGKPQRLILLWCETVLPPLHRCPLTVCLMQDMSTSVSKLSTDLRPPGRRGCDRRSNESSPPAPAPNALLDENLGIGDVPRSVLTDIGGVNRGSSGGGDPPLPLLTGDPNHPSKPTLISDSDKHALQRLVDPAVPQAELLSVIETIVSNVKAADIVKHLQLSDAQAFVNVIDQACHRTIPSLELVYSFIPTFSSPSIRHWTALTSRQKFGRNA